MTTGCLLKFRRFAKYRLYFFFFFLNEYICAPRVKSHTVHSAACSASAVVTDSHGLLVKFEQLTGELAEDGEVREVRWRVLL